MRAYEFVPTARHSLPRARSPLAGGMKPGLPFMPLLANARLLAGNGSAAQAAAGMVMLESVLASLPPLPRLPHAGWACAAAALACVAAVCVALLLLRAYLDSGGRIPLGKRCVPACAGPARRHGCARATPARARGRCAGMQRRG